MILLFSIILLFPYEGCGETDIIFTIAQYEIEMVTKDIVLDMLSNVFVVV